MASYLATALHCRVCALAGSRHALTHGGSALAQVLARNGLDPGKFLHLDFLDFAMAVIGHKINVGNLHAIHDGFDCTTFTDMAVSVSERRAENAYFGTTSLAFETNLRYHYLMAFHLFLHDQGQTELCVRTAENPKATRQFHPLSMFVMEKPKAASGGGGLGMVKANLSYCQITTSPFQSFQKDTNIWTDHTATLQLFVDVNGLQPTRDAPVLSTLRTEQAHCNVCPLSGEPSMVCDHRKGICNAYMSHAHLRPEKGDKLVRDDRGSMYPDDLCRLLVIKANQLLSIVRMQPLDPAYSADGNGDTCSGCGNRQRGGKLYCCDGCPAVYHLKCIPNGAPKPKGDDLSWFCPNADCQAKASRAIRVES